MTTRIGLEQGRRSALVLSIAHAEDVAHLRDLEDDPATDAVLCLVPAAVEPDAEVQSLWHRVAERRFVVVLRYSTGPDAHARRAGGELAAPGVLAAISRVAAWTTAQDAPGLRLMVLEPATPDGASAVLEDEPEMQGLTIHANVDVCTTTEGITMTIAPDDPFAVPQPDADPASDPGAEPDVQPIEPDDPDDVPEVPLEPTPAPDETGIR
ncbi:MULTISPECIES: hypothetical protein [unclassified Aeromicrobium]|uniref:hypothetical protein n=1 Tax=unclassified Aeromicrobium TaxID=2633570 RepID=UPI000AA21D02|nr:MULTISPECIES: hypothetical protein [unclassified Aeromicrobium]